MMTKEQAYAVFGHMVDDIDPVMDEKGAVELGLYLSGLQDMLHGLIEAGAFEDTTIQEPRPAYQNKDRLDEMDQAGAFHDEVTEKKQAHYDKDHIWWRDAEEVMPEVGSNVLIWNWNLLTDQCSIERGCWNGKCWISEPDGGEGIKNVLYWAPLNPPEEQS